MDCQLDMAVIRLIKLQSGDSSVHQVSPGIDSQSTQWMYGRSITYNCPLQQVSPGINNQNVMFCYDIFFILDMFPVIVMECVQDAGDIYYLKYYYRRLGTSRMSGLFDIGKLLLDSKLQSINCSYPFGIVGLENVTYKAQIFPTDICSVQTPQWDDVNGEHCHTVEKHPQETNWGCSTLNCALFN